MKTLEKAAIQLLFLTYIVIILAGIRINFDARKMIKAKGHINFEKRKTLYLLELLFNLFRFSGTLRVLFQRKLEYAFSVHFLNIYLVVLCISKLIYNESFIYCIISELFVHFLYVFIFIKVYYHANVIFLVRSLRVIGCDVRKMRIFMVRKFLVVQRHLIYSILFLRQLTLYTYKGHLDNHYFLVLPLMDLVIARFEIYELRITKIITILSWFLSAIVSTYLMLFNTESGEYFYRIRLAMFSILIYVHVIYNILDLFFYGYKINKLIR